MSTKNEIKPVALSEVDKQMEFYKQAVIERDRLREALESLLDCIHDTSDEDEAREKARAALNR